MSAVAVSALAGRGRHGRAGRVSVRVLAWVLARVLARVLVVLAAATGIGAFFGAQPAAAHPLGNFTVNEYAGVRVGPDEISIDHVVDLAELPAFQAKNTEIDTDRNGAVSTAERDAYTAAACARVIDTSQVRVSDQPVALSVAASRLSFPPGQGGLETMRLECTLRGRVTVERQIDVSYRGGAFPDRIGWREVTAVGDGVTLRRSDVPAESRSRRLTSYPDDLLSSPLDVRAAHLTVVPGGPRAAAGDAERSAPLLAANRGVDGLTKAFTDLVGRPQLTLAFGVLAVAISVLLGAAHAIAPGHGKTVMAAFLVGEKGSLRQAGVIALTVTVTHTAGVLVLGIMLTTSVVLAPQRVYAWLGLLSGLLLASVGGVLLRRAWRACRSALARIHDGHSHHHDGTHGAEENRDLVLVHSHVGAAEDQHGASPERGAAPEGDHGAGHRHEHGLDHAPGHEHAPGHGHHHHHFPTTLSVRSLIAMGFAGGLVPSPSALVVLLGAVALGRTWFGVLLVLGYGAGMACTLTGIGFILARWRSFFERRGAGRYGVLLRRVMPVATASLIVLVGLGLASQAAAALGS